MAGRLSSFSDGENCGLMGNPLVGTQEQRVFFSNSISQGIPIFTAGPSSPIFLSEEVHSILAYFCTEPIPLVGADILSEDLSHLVGFFQSWQAQVYVGVLI